MDIGSWAAKVDSPQSSTIVALPTTRLLPACSHALPPPNIFQAQDGSSAMEQSYKVSTPPFFSLLFLLWQFLIDCKDLLFPPRSQIHRKSEEKRWPMNIQYQVWWQTRHVKQLGILLSHISFANKNFSTLPKFKSHIQSWQILPSAGTVMQGFVAQKYQNVTWVDVCGH